MYGNADLNQAAGNATARISQGVSGQHELARYGLHSCSDCVLLSTDAVFSRRHEVTSAVVIICNTAMARH